MVGAILMSHSPAHTPDFHDLNNPYTVCHTPRTCSCPSALSACALRTRTRVIAAPAVLLPLLPRCDPCKPPKTVSGPWFRFWRLETASVRAAASQSDSAHRPSPPHPRPSSASARLR